MTRWTEEQWEEHRRRADVERRQREATRTPRRHDEEMEQTHLFAWFNLAKWRGIPLAELAYAIPNGAFLGGTERQRGFQMVRLQRMGLQPGFPDWCLPVPAAPYAGLYVEMKRRHGGRVSAEQKSWLARLRWLGHDTYVAEGADHAKQIVTTYLARTGHELVVGYAPRPEIDWSQWMGEGDAR